MYTGCSTVDGRTIILTICRHHCHVAACITKLAANDAASMGRFLKIWKPVEYRESQMLQNN